MSRAREWLDARTPPPPAELRTSVDAALDASPSEGGALDPLIRAGVRRLREAESHTGRVRASAFELLVADALVTYACEAALEARDADEALRGLADALGLGGTGP